MNYNIDQAIIGKKVLKVEISDYYLKLHTDQGLVMFEVDGDCCSNSYFHDIVGTRKLLDNGPVIAVEEVDLQPGDPGYHDPDCPSTPYSYGGDALKSPCGVAHDYLQVYGYRFVTEHPFFGEQSTVVAFRNDSNGYYGGWMRVCDNPYTFTNAERFEFQTITDDWVYEDGDR